MKIRWPSAQTLHTIPDSNYNLLKIKDNSIDTERGRYRSAQTLHKISPLPVDMPLDFIFIRGGQDTSHLSDSDEPRDV